MIDIDGVNVVVVVVVAVTGIAVVGVGTLLYKKTHPNHSNSQENETKDVIFSAIVNVKDYNNIGKDDIINLFRKSSSYWIGEKETWRNFLQKINLSPLKEVPHQEEEDIIIAYEISSLPKKEIPNNRRDMLNKIRSNVLLSQDQEIYLCPQSINILDHGFREI
ncbi:MAG: hypothetical protein IJ934_03315 [Acetobacter sp.]|nr:hypothetical protein [Acetobacter sp.]